jgi:hypothetical protein
MALMGATFDTVQELLKGVMRLLNGILREECETVFDQWLKRLDACIQQYGEYVE